MCFRVLLLACFFSCCYVTAGAQLPKAQQQAIILKRMIEKNHFSSRAVNDSFSSSMFAKIIREIDPHEDILTQDDYTILSGYRYKLDDELNGKGWAFVDQLGKILKPALQRADSVINVVLQKPLDFNVDEKVTFSNEHAPAFAVSVSEIKNRWTKWFKFLALNVLYDLAAGDSTHPSLKTVFARQESLIRQKIKKVEQADIQQLLKPENFEDYITDIYLNALSTGFDPHTAFFSAKQKENFQSVLSTEEFSFGFLIDEANDGKIVIAQLIPGGPAWKSGELHKNDELLQLQWEGKEAVDISVLTAHEVEGILRQYNHGNITVKVKKVNGTTRTVLLRKEKIEVEEDIVRGYILKGEKKIGYISLPDFYTNWEDINGSGCANDVAKEIVKLKKENIEGLILDVRYNGGGSTSEALQLSGIFIDEGPLMGVRDKTGKLSFAKDPNRGVIYDGPMILMVNGQSASASEMLAGALQDYNRAVIVGSPTYGKATMQQILPMDTTYTTAPPRPSTYGFTKITIGKLYRVSGQTAQLSGVTPDIYLPDAFEGLEYSEKFHEDVLPADTVKRNAYYKPLPALPIATLAGLSQQRVNNSKGFNDIKAAVKIQSAIVSSRKQVIPLKLETFETWMKQRETSENNLDEEAVASKFFTAENHQLDKQRIANNAYAKAINEVKVKNLQQDIYIEEAFQVISDLVKLKK